MDRHAGYLEPDRAEGPHENEGWEKAENVMFDVWSPILLLLGVPGNVLSLLVLGRLWQRVPTYLFFMALSASDLGILLFGVLPDWLINHDVYIEDSISIICGMVKWLAYTHSTMASFFITGVTVFRALSVARPVQMRNVRPRTVQWIIAAITVGTFALNIYVPFNKALVKGKCDWTSSFLKNHYATITWINAFLNFGLPVLAMAISYVVMLRVLVRKRFHRKMHVRKVRNKVTAIVIVTSLTFIILSVPTCIVRVLRYVDPTNQDKPYYSFLYNFTLLLWYTNAAITFYLYICTGDDLRHKFLDVTYMMLCRLIMTKQVGPPRSVCPSNQSRIELEFMETSSRLDTTASPLPVRSSRRVKMSATVAPSHSAPELSEAI